MTAFVGTGQDQIPVNGMLGTMAFQNKDSVVVTDLTAAGTTQIGTNLPNYQSLVGAVTTKTPTISALGTDTNISLALIPKGTGGIDLATGSSGVNISNGNTITAITRTLGGNFYTSAPTWTASAPTTAGGVTASGTTTIVTGSAPAITNGGTGYTVNDVLTFVGGTFVGGSAATITVTSVSGGVITGVSLTSGGNLYTVAPTNPISVTGGTGSGATFTTTNWGVQSTVNITNAGSGYTEQPTITFSGGGGSGAAAYAVVGSATKIQTLGNTLSFNTPAGEAFRITDYTASGSSGYWTAFGPSASPQLRAIGTGAPIIGTSSAIPLAFYTNQGGTGVQQFAIAHTASAVNSVQVTGSATNADPVISVQGSDASRNLKLTAKGTGAIQTTQRLEIGTASFNYVQINGVPTNNATSIVNIGSDTNISLALVPKGTGIVLTNQNTPVAYNATATLLIADILSQIITSTSATAVALTLPTGTLTDAGISAGTSAVNTAFEWSIINLGSATGAVTLGAGTGHTIVGSSAIAISTTGRFKTVKTATNTFITYRIA